MFFYNRDSDDDWIRVSQVGSSDLYLTNFWISYNSNSLLTGLGPLTSDFYKGGKRKHLQLCLALGYCILYCHMFGPV